MVLDTRCIDYIAVRARRDFFFYLSTSPVWNIRFLSQQCSRSNWLRLFLSTTNLSAAFDTHDHSILLHRLFTWFDISSVSLQRFSSYLSSRTSTVGIPPQFPSSPLTCGVPQGSVLDQFLSVCIPLLLAI